MEKDCHAFEIIKLIGNKWTLVIIRELCGETPKGFNELQRLTAGISPKVLSERLKDLVEAGMVTKKVLPTNPPQVEYSLTKKGMTLKPIMRQLFEWAEQA